MFRSYVDQTLGYFDRPRLGVPDGPVDDPAAWRSADLVESDWLRSLSPVEADEFAALGNGLVARGRPLEELTRDQIDASALAGLAERCRFELDAGLGVVLLQGAPVDEMDVVACEAAFWAFGLLLGWPGAQNGAGELLGHVTDYHDPADTSLAREYRSTVDINFHCDAADVVGLLCLSTSAEGGESRIVSSVAVFNELLATQPDLAARLCEEVELDTRSDGEGFPHVPVVPVCFDGKRVRTFMHLGYFRSAARHPDVVLDDRLAAALDAWEAVAARPDMHLDMALAPGDLQLCSNHTIAHARRGYVDDPTSPRHLLRLWVTL